ncbi:hypothetical protein S245_028865 [Arachis hypogaea]
MLGVYLQRSWAILSVTSLLLMPIYIFAAPILKFLGQQHDIADRAGTFAPLVIPQFLSLAFNFPTQKFLQAQSKVNIITWIGFFALILHVVMLWLFIYVLQLGLTGAALAFDITSWVITLAQLAYVFFWCKEGWHGLSWKALKDIWPFVRLSLESAVMLCLEVWYMMSLIVLAGHLDNAVIAVDSLYMHEFEWVGVHDLYWSKCCCQCESFQRTGTWTSKSCQILCLCNNTSVLSNWNPLHGGYFDI